MVAELTKNITFQNLLVINIIIIIIQFNLKKLFTKLNSIISYYKKCKITFNSKNSIKSSFIYSRI